MCEDSAFSFVQTCRGEDQPLGTTAIEPDRSGGVECWALLNAAGRRHLVLQTMRDLRRQAAIFFFNFILRNGVDVFTRSVLIYQHQAAGLFV